MLASRRSKVSRADEASELWMSLFRSSTSQIYSLQELNILNTVRRNTYCLAREASASRRAMLVLYFSRAFSIFRILPALRFVLRANIKLCHPD